MGLSDDRLWIVYDQRGIFDPDAAAVLAVAGSKAEAIRDCREQGGGCVWSPEGGLVYWLDGENEWDETCGAKPRRPQKTPTNR